MEKKTLNRFFISIVLPSVLTIGLYILSIFVAILPSFERNVMNGKKEMIAELTNSVCSLIEEYHEEVMDGRLTEDSARQMAIERVRQIHYGDEDKDYFWITNTEPRMIMHPYRPGLNGKMLDDYRDPEGTLLFVEAVEEVAGDGEGFIHYRWQWKDDSTRIVPKLSYVKAFEAWDWIVGTGIYLEDVRQEISFLKIRLLRVALLITLVVAILMAFIIRQSLTIERRRSEAEHALRLSREKYRMLVEASTEGTLMLSGESFIFSNIRFGSLSGYLSDEIKQLAFADLFSLDWPSLEGSIDDPKKSVSRECSLNCKDGSTREVVLSVSRVNQSSSTAYIIVVKELTAHMHQNRESQKLERELQAALSLMSIPLKAFAVPAVKCDMETSVMEAAVLMKRKDSDLLVIVHNDAPIGMLNFRDLCLRGMGGDYDPKQAVSGIMRSPVLSLDSGALLHESLILMQKEGASHLLIRDKRGGILGTIGPSQLLSIQKNSVEYLIREIESAESPAGMAGLYARLPVMIGALVEGGSSAPVINRILARAGDAFHRRVCELALEEMGPPPCPFAFIVLGSQGRGEQTLATDQDNAIIFRPEKDTDRDEASRWFLALGKKLNGYLATVGYRLCPGDVMAGNPKWNKDLHGWKAYFSEWFIKGDPQNILDTAIFFDARFIHGDISIVDELRDHVNQSYDSRSVFFYHMARSIIQIKFREKPPDLKKILLPLSSFIRLRALQEKLALTNSGERLEALRESGAMDHESAEEMEALLDRLMLMRIRTQTDAISRNESPGNIMKDLSPIDEVIIKKLQSDVAELQTRLSAAFPSPPG